MNKSIAPARRQRRIQTLATLVVLACLWLAPGLAMAANECNLESSDDIAFGAVGSGSKSTSGSIKFYCQNDDNGTRTFRACLYMDPSNPGGVAPRRMILWYPVDYLLYDLYADPGMTQLVGSTDSGHDVFSVTMTLTGKGKTSGIIPIYARTVPQTATAGSYVSQIVSVLRTASQPGTTPPTVAECSASPIKKSNYIEVRANFANTCYIGTATDMVFGSVANLGTEVLQTSMISVRCPQNTSWRVSLDYGTSPLGTTRRMTGPGGSRITYELYRDPGRSQPWGNTQGNSVSGTAATQDLFVYGRVPPQPVAAPGTYSDTITITLTY